MNTSSKLAQAVALALACLISGPIHAGITTDQGDFSTTNQAMFGPLGGAQPTSYDSGSLGPNFTVSPTGGLGISCGFLGCFGSQSGLNLSGNFGFDLTSSVGLGSISASVPLTSTITFQDQLAGAAPLFSPGVSMAVSGGSFQTIAPSYSGGLSLSGGLSASAFHESCTVSCSVNNYPLFSGGFSSVPVWGFNQNGTGQASILGTDVGPNSVTGQIGPVSFTLGQPQQALGANPGGDLSGVITGSVSADVASVGVNLAEIVAEATDIPFDGNIPLVLSWDLGSADLTTDVLFNQSFTVSPTVVLDLHVVQTGQDLLCTASGCGAGLTLPDYNALSTTYGDPSGMLTVDPTYFLSASLSNETGIQFAPGYSFGLLSANILGDQIGPALQLSQNFPLGQIDLFDQTFALGGWNILDGAPFDIQVVQAVAEPEELGLLAVALIALGLPVILGRGRGILGIRPQVS